MTTQELKQVTKGYKYTDYTFNSTGWDSICEVVSNRYEDKFTQEIKVKVKMTFENKQIEPKYMFIGVNRILNDYKQLN